MNGRTMLMTLMVAVTCLQGCNKSESISEPTPLVENYEISLGSYSLNHYFVDTSYRALYERYYQNDPPLINPGSRIVEAEVWVSRLGASNDTSERFGIAWMNLPPRPVTGYDSSYRNSPDFLGSVEFSRFRRLDPSSYRLDGDGYIGVVSFGSLNINDFAVYAISYRRADGKQYGDFVRNGFESWTTTRMTLKMIKPRNLLTTGRIYHVAWGMLLKNIYSIRAAHISRHEFILQVFRGNESSIQGQSLLNVLGLDRYAADGTLQLGGDGLFDFLPGRTIKQDDGEIIFPYLRPLDDGIRAYFLQRGLPVPDSTYRFSELYDTLWTVAQQSTKNMYLLRGRAIFN